MKLTQLLLALLAFSGVDGFAAQTEARTQAEEIQLSPEQLKALAVEMTEMARLDQLHRSAVQWGTVDPDELARLDALDDDATMKEWVRREREGIALDPKLEKELMAKQNKIDKANVTRLAEIIKASGYPDPARYEVDFPSPEPILIHAQLEDYLPLQSLLLKEAQAGRMRPKAFAAIYDRKLQHSGKVQLYGTGFAIDIKTGETLPPEVEDIDATNKARKELGLPPLLEYRIAPKRDEK